MLIPAIQAARENQRLNACRNNLKQLGLCLNNYQDKQMCLPPISSNLDLQADILGNDAATTDQNHIKPGSRLSSGAGYSWMVWILPQLDEVAFFEEITRNSITNDFPRASNFTKSAFDPTIVNGNVAPKATHAATAQFAAFRCPSFSGGSVVDISPRVAGTTTGQVETGTVPPNYFSGIATANGASGIAITNYNAILGTHIDGTAADGYPARSASLEKSNNGAMSFRGQSFDRGRGLQSISDGTAYTFLVVETKERRLSSWYDGTMNWVVATRHSNPSAGTVAIIPATKPESGPDAGRWQVLTDGTDDSGGTALNYGPTSANPTAVYLPIPALSDPDISGIQPGRLWGPSSEHRAGIVNHLAADGHIAAIPDDIHANTYLWFTTRAGGEITNCCDEPPGADR